MAQGTMKKEWTITTKIHAGTTSATGILNLPESDGVRIIGACCANYPVALGIYQGKWFALVMAVSNNNVIPMANTGITLRYDIAE